MGVRGTEGEKEVYPSLEYSSHSLHLGVLRVSGPVAMAAGEGLSGSRWLAVAARTAPLGRARDRPLPLCAF